MRAFAYASAPLRAAHIPRQRPLHRKRALSVDTSREESDEDLLLKVAAGEREAFAALFGGYARKVKSYLIRLGAAPAVAEDLAQDAMVSVWRRAASFDASKAKASTWIFVIARNAWIDKLRRERVELAYRQATPPAEESPEEAPDDAAEREQAAVHIAAAIETLSDEQRKVVQLAFFEDRPHSEIAERLSLPLGTVKSRLRLALIKLRTHWEQLR
jgi:RNA polymerase sigma-70 factor (ECF subfamily)